MRIGVTMFATDYAIPPHELAVEAEARGFESVWFPEHSHIPTSRKSPWPGGAELPKWYYDTYDPFVAMGAAAIWAHSKPKYSGELVKFDEMMQWPKPVQTPHPPIIVGGGFPQGARRAVAYADGWMPIGGRGGDTLAMLPPFREMLKAAGRAESDVPVTLFGVGMNGEGLKRAGDAGV